MTVLIGYVPTPEGAAALDHAITEARERDARLVVVNTSRGDAHVDRRYAADAELDSVTTRLREAGIKHDVIHGIRGRDAADEILALSEELDVRGIVIGVRHRTPVGKLLLGSNSQRILLEAACPVIAVKAARTERAKA